MPVIRLIHNFKLSHVHSDTAWWMSFRKSLLMHIFSPQPLRISEQILHGNPSALRRSKRRQSWALDSDCLITATRTCRSHKYVVFIDQAYIGSQRQCRRVLKHSSIIADNWSINRTMKVKIRIHYSYRTIFANVLRSNFKLDPQSLLPRRHKMTFILLPTWRE